MAAQKSALGLIALLSLPLLVFAGFLAIPLLLIGGACSDNATETINLDKISADVVSTSQRYSVDQAKIAAEIMNVGRERGLSTQDQQVAVMVALGKSNLQKELNNGPVTTVGVFQFGNSVGSYEDRADVKKSAALFYDLLERIPATERASAEGPVLGQRALGGTDPMFYKPYWAEAQFLNTALIELNANEKCDTSAAGQVNDLGWALPAGGIITSNFGPRGQLETAGGRTKSFHDGTDLAGGGCDGPIWAAAQGTATFVGFDNRGNGTITLDHGSGIVTKYLHMYSSGMFIRTGDTVSAGQQIGKVGNSGQSRGCHLHFEILVDGTAVDPVPTLAKFGIKLGG